jgi:hypothetical protein
MTPEWRKNISEGAKLAWQDPDLQEKYSEAASAAWYDAGMMLISGSIAASCCSSEERQTRQSFPIQMCVKFAA